MMDYDEDDGWIEAHDRREAERMSDRSFEDQVQKYIESAGDLFEEAFSWPNPVTYAQKLTDRLELDERKLRHGIVRAEFLSPDEAERLIAALQLPFDVRYSEFTYVGSGGSYPDDEKYDEEEQWATCDETEQRSALVGQLSEYCLSAGAVAKQIGAAKEQRLFMRCLELIEVNCHGHSYENGYGGMPKKDAESVCGWLCLATQHLWSQIQIDNRRQKWMLEANGELELTPAEKKGDALVKQACAGVVAEKESQERFNETSARGAAAAGEAECWKMGDEEPDTSGIIVGEWAKKVLLSVNGTTRTLVVKGNKGPGEVLVCPLGADEPWKHLRGMIESTDPEGWYEVPEEDLGCYRQQFLRSDKNKNGNLTANAVALRRIYAHVQNRNESGEHAATHIRLMRRRERKLGARAKKSESPPCKKV